jgi:hypothetical protein
MPVLADTLADALHRARDYPYSSNWICVCDDNSGESNAIPEDRPSPAFMSARESAIDEQAAWYGETDEWDN